MVTPAQQRTARQGLSAQSGFISNPL